MGVASSSQLELGRVDRDLDHDRADGRARRGVVVGDLEVGGGTGDGVTEGDDGRTRGLGLRHDGRCGGGVHRVDDDDLRAVGQRAGRLLGLQLGGARGMGIQRRLGARLGQRVAERVLDGERAGVALEPRGQQRDRPGDGGRGPQRALAKRTRTAMRASGRRGTRRARGQAPRWRQPRGWVRRRSRARGWSPRSRATAPRRPRAGRRSGASRRRRRSACAHGGPSREPPVESIRSRAGDARIARVSIPVVASSSAR